jgi:hypothetical protein
MYGYDLWLIHEVMRMFRFVPQLRSLAVLLLGGLLVACAAQRIPIDDGAYVCGPTENIAVCFFKGSGIQGDSPTKPIYEALRDGLTLPLEELRAKRYIGSRGEPNKRTFMEMLCDYYTTWAQMPNGDRVSPRSEGFMEAVTQPETKPTLKKLVDGLEEALTKGEYWDWDGLHSNEKQEGK